MENIKFNYRYRDGSNFKNRGEVVFSNPHHVPVGVASSAMQRLLWGDDLFIAHQIRVPEVFLFAKGDISSDDHCFHEFDSFELTRQSPNDRHGRTVSDFIAEIERKAKDDWPVFDPLDRIS